MLLKLKVLTSLFSVKPLLHAFDLKILIVSGSGLEGFVCMKEYYRSYCACGYCE